MPRMPPSHKPPRAKLPGGDGRPSAARRGYGPLWRKVRAVYLASHPLCVDCQAKGLLTPALHVDHVLAIEKGGTNDEANLQSLCHSCHSRKTVLCDNGLNHDVRMKRRN